MLMFGRAYLFHVPTVKWGQALREKLTMLGWYPDGHDLHRSQVFLLDR